ncbi:hypothetical protein AN958_09783 [Leucoagaricus sp. SymC.cos]|nr:hypothetical protein AN958_09783 [Leucoagaricus sp. SymC.cos]
MGGSSSKPSVLPTQDDCHKLLSDIAALPNLNITKGSTSTSMKREDAQYAVNFLSQVINDPNYWLENDRGCVLHLLAKIVKAQQVFPRWLYLESMRFDYHTATPDGDEGGSGAIYKTKYYNKLVCVKVLHLPGGEKRKKKLRALAGEVIFWAHISHPNIIPLLGIYDSKGPDSRVCLVSP